MAPNAPSGAELRAAPLLFLPDFPLLPAFGRRIPGRGVSSGDSSAGNSSLKNTPSPPPRDFVDSVCARLADTSTGSPHSLHFTFFPAYLSGTSIGTKHASHCTEIMFSLPSQAQGWSFAQRREPQCSIAAESSVHGSGSGVNSRVWIAPQVAEGPNRSTPVEGPQPLLHRWRAPPCAASVRRGPFRKRMVPMTRTVLVDGEKSLRRGGEVGELLLGTCPKTL